MSGFKLIVPLLSLVDAEHRPLVAALSGYLPWLKTQGIDALLVMGTTGEFAHFSVAERVAYLEAVAEAADGLPLMVNIGAASLSDTLALQAHAMTISTVSSVLWMPPFYFPAKAVNGLSQTVCRVLEAQPEDVPFYLYHHPAMSQVPVIPELLDVSPRIAGAKDSSGNWDNLAAAVQSHPQQGFFAGTDFAVSKAQDIGCCGVIGGMMGLFPDLFVMASRGDVSAEATLKGLRASMTSVAKMPAMKAWFNQMGFSESRTVSALPFVDLSEDEAQRVVLACREALAFPQ